MIPILLMMVAIILFAVFAPFGILVTIILVFIKDSRERFVRFSDYPFGIAHTVDILGNIVCGELFNMVLIRHNSYLFGARTETISSVLGKNIIHVFVWKYWFYTININLEINKRTLFKYHRIIQIKYKQSPKLTRLGNVIANTLDSIDDNHCIKSIQNF